MSCIALSSMGYGGSKLSLCIVHNQFTHALTCSCSLVHLTIPLSISAHPSLDKPVCCKSPTVTEIIYLPSQLSPQLPPHGACLFVSLKIISASFTEA